MNAITEALSYMTTACEQAKQAEPIIKEVIPGNRIMITGTYCNSCEICDNQISEGLAGKELQGEGLAGKKILYSRKGVHYKAVVCNRCFYEQDYQDMLSRIEGIKIYNY